MSEQEAIAYIEEWDVTEAAKVLKWYEEHELLRPCDCDTIVAIETEYLQVENAKLRELVRIAGTYCVNGLCGKDDGCPLYLGKPYCALPDRMRELGIEVDA